MDTTTVLAALNKQAGNIEPIGAKIKFKLDENVILIDGTGSENIISQDDAEADCTISMAMSDFIKLKDGDLNPMMAVMSGKIKIKGDMGLALKLQSLI